MIFEDFTIINPGQRAALFSAIKYKLLTKFYFQVHIIIYGSWNQKKKKDKLLHIRKHFIHAHQSLNPV